MDLRRTAILFVVAVLAFACESTEPEVVVVTATSEPPSRALTPTKMPISTSTSSPSPTPTAIPSSTPEPTIDPVSIGDIETAFRDAGYKRFPFTGADSVTGYDWIKESAYEQATTWDFGGLEINVLHDNSAKVRMDHMERKFEVLDNVFPSDFMASLREQYEAYNQQVRTEVSGEPDEVYSYGDEWQTVWAEYYVSETIVQGYYVRFSLWWWQSTCPSKYLYCYYNDFPGLEFTGDSSFVFQTIYLEPAEESLTGGST